MTTVQKWAIGIGATAVLAFLVYLIFFYHPKPPAPPNEKLIEYLENQRKHSDSAAAALQIQINQLLASSRAREHKDSADLISQNRIIESIKNIKSQYEKIPSYINLSNDSLRRLYAKQFGQ